MEPGADWRVLAAAVPIAVVRQPTSSRSYEACEGHPKISHNLNYSSAPESI